MTQRDDLDRMLSGWLDDPYTPPAPRYLTQVLERTRHTRQRPAWANLERWIPMADKVLARPASPPARIARLLLVALLVLALAAVVAVVGAQLLKPKVLIPQGGAAVLVFASIVGDSGDIFTVRADGTDLRQLTSGPGARTSPAFSPDGTRIAYRQWQGGTDSIVVMDAGGGHALTLAATPVGRADCARGGLAWSPDGKSLVFAINALCDTQIDLFIVASDGSSPAMRLLVAGTSSTAADWSADGTRIAFVASEAGGSLGTYVAEVGSGVASSGGLQARRIGPGPVATLDNVGIGPQWSPDGTQLVSINETGGVFLMQSDGSGQRLVAEQAYNPTWSPDGRRLAFHRTVDPSEYISDRPCTARIWVVDSDGTNERRLEDLGDGCDAAPLWSPDGTRISASLAASTDAEPSLGPHLGIITVDGSSPTVILQDGPAVSWQPVVAPLPPPPSFPASPAP